MWICNFPVSFIENTVILLVRITGNLVRDQLLVEVWVSFWDLYLISLVYGSVCMLIPECFTYYVFIIYFEVKWYDAS